MPHSKLNQKLKKVALVTRPAPPQAAQELIDSASALFEREGVEVWRGIVPDDGSYASIVSGCDMVFALGGDGTILYAAKIAATHAVPIVGVDFGRFGFLAELDPQETLEKLPAFVRGEHWLEERATLKAEVWRQDKVVSELTALNDIVVGRDSLSGIIDVQLTVNDEYVTTFIGDGLIVSTATGSTAYNLATGGPVLDPTMGVIVISAIAPHLSHLGHMVLPRRSTVKLHVGTRRGAAIGVDGQPDFSIQDKDMLRLTTGDFSAYFARLQPKSYFYTTLADRLRRGG